MIFYYFPEDLPLVDLLSKNIAGLMDQNINETFFTFSLEDYHMLNYLFELDSRMARGHKESLLISIIFDEHTSQETEQLVSNLCTEFVENVKMSDTIFAAFHLNEMALYNKSDKNLIMKSNDLIREMVKELYWATVEETKEKPKEEELNILLYQDHVSETLQLLRRAPKPYEETKKWFEKKFPKQNFDKMIDTLTKMRFINTNIVDGNVKYIYFFKKTLIKEILFREVS